MLTSKLIMHFGMDTLVNVFMCDVLNLISQAEIESFEYMVQ